MAVTLKITNSAGVSLFVSPDILSLPQSEINLPQALNATFESNLTLFENEDSDANAVQLRATVLMDRDGTQEFEGSITFKNISKIGDSKWLISISALDRLADGQRSRASQSGEDNWEIESPSSSTGSQVMLRTRLMVREPFNDPVVRFLPSLSQAEWALGSPAWEDLISYNSSPLNQTRYSTIQDGEYTINAVAPAGPNTDILIDATGLPNIDDEFIVGELMLVKGADESEYAPFTILTNSGITANVLTITVEGSVTLPGSPTALPLTLELTSDQNGIFPGGLNLLDDEPFWFDGYDITDAGNYMVRRMRRGTLTLQDVSPSTGIHTSINSYTAVKAGADVLITSGATYDIKVSQNALFPVGAIVTLWLVGVQQGGNFTVATTAWASPTATITTDEALPAAFDEIRTQNRVINIRPQRIAKGEFVFEGQDSTNQWNNITEKQFDINLNAGYPETTLDSTILGSRWDGDQFKPADNWRSTYNYYPESTAKSVSDIIEAVGGEAIADGGWGLTAGEIEASDLTGKITKADNSSPVNTVNYFNDFFVNLGLMGDENIIGYIWDSANSQWLVKRLLQGTVSNSYSRIMSIARDLVTDEISSGLMVTYQLPAPVNFAAINLWAATDEGSMGVYPANGVAPIAYGVLPNGVRDWDFAFWAAGSDRATIIKNHATFPQSLLLDGLTNSGYALEYEDTPGVDAPDSTTGAQFFVWMDEAGYYSGIATSQKTVKRVKIVVEISRWSNINVYPEPSIDIEVLGYTAFTSPKAEDAGGGTDTIPVANPANEVKLPALKYLLPSQDEAFSQEVTLEADNINLNLAAVGLKFNKAPTDNAGATNRNVQLKVKEIIVEESTDRSLFVAITDTPADGSSRTLYAPETYSKLVNPTHLVSEPVALGVVSTGAAISLARSILLQRLVLEDSREFEIDIKGLPLPRRMETQRIFSTDSADEYTGVVLSRGYELINGLETCVVLLRDLTAPLLT